MQGSEGVLRCLQERREELSYECRSWLFHSEVRMAKDGDSKHPMKQASPALLLEGYRSATPSVHLEASRHKQPWLRKSIFQNMVWKVRILILVFRRLQLDASRHKQPWLGKTNAPNFAV